MNTKQPDVKEIFCAALEKKSAAQRNAYLDEACGGDSKLRAEVEELLRAHNAAGGFLEEPLGGVDVTLDDSPVTEGPGTKIGRYKLLELIGEGGFGVVYMAEQAKPIRRRVALKIIKLGMDTKQVIARFEAERQALALMDHPNIAKVLDAGATETGRPYFVMELVKGIRITEYCDKNNLDTHQRLELFIDVCKAVQHAHQKGIIHRDIKPSNVLVTLRDDDSPVPKIIDFGIAKATQARLTEKTLFTEFKQFVGTPEYMSPEQARMGELDIDTRSDIYSLGVLLYELLTGTTPFKAKELRSAAFDEIVRIIREEEPDKPSTRLSALGDTLAEVAKHRQVEPGQLCKIIRGDLDWIVLKTLEKDRARRYETANGLARDIERHLSDEPVTAGPPSTVYRMKKFVRRNRTAVAVALAILATLIIGLSLATVGFVQASHQRNRAVLARTAEAQQRQRAEANFQKARGAVEEMMRVAQWRVPDRMGTGLLQLRRDLLERAQVFYEGFLEENSDALEVREDMGRAYKLLGDINIVLGRHEQAEHAYRQAVEVFEKLVKESPDMAEVQMELAYSKNGLGLVLEALGRHRELEDAYRAGAAILKPLTGKFTLGTATNLGPTVNSSDNDFLVNISADGLTLYFTSRRPGGSGESDLWVTTRITTSDPWGPPVNLGPTVNSEYIDAGPSISADGLSLFFNSTRPGGYGSYDIWVSKRATKVDDWGTPANLGPTVNTEYLDSTPSVSSDGLSLFFESNRSGGSGGWDLWVTTRETRDDDWGNPVNLGSNINSPCREQTPSISADGLTLFFSSNRPGGFGIGSDLWVATRETKDDFFGLPVNLGPAVNSVFTENSPNVSADGSTLYFAAFPRAGGSGGLDLWQVEVGR